MALPKDAKARKEVPLYSGVHRYFPAALQGVAKVSLNGSRQHHGTDELYDDRSKSNDDLDCALRHLEDAFIGDGMDGEVAHIDKAAWRVLRVAQKWHEERGADVAPAARCQLGTVNVPTIPLKEEPDRIAVSDGSKVELVTKDEYIRRYCGKAYDRHPGYALSEDAE